MKDHARLFNCVRCHSQVVICSDCDRGNIYCADCAQPARVACVRAAKARYQKTQRGRQRHAQRQRRYRQRKKNKVTDHGSQHLLNHDEVLPEAKALVQQKETYPIQGKYHCDFCGRGDLYWLRADTLCRTIVRETRLSSWPRGP